eukprot:6474356-Amphidinium_carterae.1
MSRSWLLEVPELRQHTRPRQWRPSVVPARLQFGGVLRHRAGNPSSWLRAGDQASKFGPGAPPSEFLQGLREKVANQAALLQLGKPSSSRAVVPSKRQQFTGCLVGLAPLWS